MDNTDNKKEKQRHFSIYNTDYLKYSHHKANKTTHFAIYLKKTLAFLYFEKSLCYICKQRKKTIKKHRI